MPSKAQQVLSQNVRYKILYGGRGSGKSYAFAHYLIAKSLEKKVRILATRELQTSIRDSVYKLLIDRIDALGLRSLFYITQDSIVAFNGSIFIFRGIKANHSEIKSSEGIQYCWCEESEKLSQESLDVLIPTIRLPGSEILFSFNPETQESPVYQRFVLNPNSDVSCAKLNWYDNEYFPEAVLGPERDHCKIVDYEKFSWIWLGNLKQYAQDVIFKDKIVTDGDFDTPDGVRFYFGLDFGFSNDPLSAHRYWEKEDGDFTDLYIDYEVYGTGIELDDMHKKLWEGLPGLQRGTLKADSARPDSISFLRRPFNKNGKTWPAINCVGAEKGKGSLEDGIDFLRNYRKIYIHRRCPGAKDDYQNYRWKRHPKTNEILSEPVDKSNHTCDESRYALEALIKSKVSGFEAVMKRRI